jgi:colanic acid biosynthesis glycosyl transferase WcaI
MTDTGAPSSDLSASDVLFVTPYYRPEMIGSAPYCADIAEFLAKQGRRVRVVTAQPHYPLAQLFGAPRARSEVISGVAVERLQVWTPPRRSTLARLASEFSFLLAGVQSLLSGRVPRANLVLSLCPSILCAAVGIIAKRRGGRHVAIVHDIQSGLAEGLGMVGSGQLIRVFQWFEKSILNRVDLIAVLTPEMRRQLKRIGVRTPIEVIPIWADTDAIHPLPEPADASPRIVYSGNLGRKQGLGQLVALAEELQRRRSEITLVIRGNGGCRDELAEQIAARRLNNVLFSDLLPPSQLNDGLATGRIHLVPQEPGGADFAVPSKVFNIMAAGRSFVATAAAGTSLWQLQRASEAFLCVPPNDAAAFVEAVLRLSDDAVLRREMAARGQRFVLMHHAKQKVLDNFSRLLDDLCPG